MKLLMTIGATLVAVALATSANAGGNAESGKALAATCAACHGEDGNSTIATNPKLAGQYESYLVRALTDYRSGARQNATMAPFASGLKDQDIRDLAAWFSSQKSTLVTPSP